MVILLFCFSDQPFIGIDSDTFFFYFILKLFKEARGSAGIIIIISRKTVKITSGF